MSLWTTRLELNTSSIQLPWGYSSFLRLSMKTGLLISVDHHNYLFLNRNASINYELPDDLTPGLYRVFAYDIESDGRLHNGVGYPASRDQFTIAGNSQSEVVN